jgi:hypothetical protein
MHAAFTLRVLHEELIKVTETLQAQEIMLATLSGGLVVMFGALYSMLFAFARLRHPFLMPFAYAAYALFAASTLVLARSLHLEGYWLVIVFVMLAGYFLAPHGIWHLCVGTHVNEEHESEGDKP